MIAELSPTDPRSYAAGFEGPHAAMVVASIVEGNTAGQLWAAPPLALLWDKGNNVFYLAGPRPTDTALRELARLVQGTIRPQALAEGLGRVKAHALSPTLDDALAALFEGVTLQAYPTLFFGLPDAPLPPTPAPTLPVQLVPIDGALLARADLANLDPVRDEIVWMWQSEARFLARGFGWAALVGGDVACWCTAEYVSAARCGIGIATAPAYEGCGIATATAARFVQACRERGIQPFWECGRANLASVQVAEKVGFRRLAEERFWVGSFEG